MTTGYSKSEKIDPWVSKSKGKGTKSEPRDTKSEPKGTQREPKGAKSEPAGAKSDPTGAKREPKVSQIQHKINIKERVAKKGGAGLRGYHPLFPGYFLEPFGSHFHEKSMKNSMRKSMPKKS